MPQLGLCFGALFGYLLWGLIRIETSFHLGYTAYHRPQTHNKWINQPWTETSRRISQNHPFLLYKLIILGILHWRRTDQSEHSWERNHYHLHFLDGETEFWSPSQIWESGLELNISDSRIHIHKHSCCSWVPGAFRTALPILMTTFQQAIAAPFPVLRLKRILQSREKWTVMPKVAQLVRHQIQVSLPDFLAQKYFIQYSEETELLQGLYDLCSHPGYTGVTHHVLIEVIHYHPGQARVTPVAMHKQELLEVAEAGNGEVTGHDSLRGERRH